jgi:hypothetical protein
MSFTESLRGLFELRSLRGVDATGDFHGEAFISRERKSSNAYAARRDCYGKVKSSQWSAQPLTFQAGARSIAAHETIRDWLDITSALLEDFAGKIRGLTHFGRTYETATPLSIAEAEEIRAAGNGINAVMKN